MSCDSAWSDQGFTASAIRHVPCGAGDPPVDIRWPPCSTSIPPAAVARATWLDGLMLVPSRLPRAQGHPTPGHDSAVLGLTVRFSFRGHHLDLARPIEAPWKPSGDPDITTLRFSVSVSPDVPVNEYIYTPVIIGMIIFLIKLDERNPLAAQTTCRTKAS
jgi:hypothetical protein